MPVQEKETIADTVIANTDDKLIEYALSAQEYIDQFIPIIKSELINKNSLNDLIDKLETVSVQKEEELQEISFNSIDDITHSVKVINQIVNSTESISKNIVQVNKSLNRSGKLLLEEKKKVLNLKQTKQRIEDTNNKINSCLEILDLTNKILELIKTGDFYRSLILLRSLSSNNLKELDTFQFVTQFLDAIPSFKLLIVDETFDQLNRWSNLSIERNLSECGELIFENFKNINDSWAEKQESNLQLIGYKVNSPVEMSFRSDKLKTFDPLSKVNIELEPFFHSILVFNELAQMDDLKEYFSNDILRRIDHLFIPIKDSINKLNVFSSNESLKINLFSLCSFSVLDRLIGEKTDYQIRSIDDINNSYSSIVKKFLPILSNHIEYSDFDLNDLIDLNDTLGLYYQILTSYNFDCNSIYKLMLKVFNKFTNKLIETFKKSYSKLSLNDNSQHLIINSPSEFLKVSNDVFYIFHVKNPEFPMQVPFSSIYLDTCILLKDFIDQLYSFISKYYINDTNLLISKISKAIDDVLINIILKDLDDKIKSTYKEVVSQNLINLDFYSSSIHEIEKYLNYSDNKVIMRSRSFSTLIRLNSIEEFKKTRRLAIESMFTMIDFKVHSLFDMVDFDWNSDEVKSGPDTSIIDLIEFLQDSFKLNFSHLPESIKSLLLLKILDKIAKFLNDAIFESDTLTPCSVKNFQIDIEYIEDSIPNFFDSNVNIDDSSMEPLKNLFTKLQQTTNLLVEGNLDSYKIADIRLRKFNKIDPDEAVALINKLPSLDTFDANDESNETLDTGNGSSYMDTSQDDVRSIFGLKRSTTLFKKS